jgi:hypothetical protein
VSRRYEWSPVPPKLPRDGVAQVVEALLPMLIWQAPVTKVVSHGLSVVERFIIEAALDLGDVSVADVAEVTGLPRDLAARVTARVAGVGVLEPLPEGGGYRPVQPAAGEALASAELREFHRTHLTFLYLPTTEDLLAYPAGPRRAEPPHVHRITPVYNAPLPDDVVGRPAAEFLDERIAAGTVPGLPDWVFGAEPDEARMPETCPTYRCRGHLKPDAAVLTLVDARTDRTQPCQLPGAVRLTNWFTGQAEALDGAFSRWDEPSATRERSTVDGRAGWVFPVWGGLARQMMDSELPLTRPLGLTVTDEEATLAVAARLVPNDRAAHETFALDHAVDAVLAQPLERLTTEAVEAAVAAAGTEYDHQPTVGDVRGELWRRGQFFRVYQLRAADDFAYD